MSWLWSKLLKPLFKGVAGLLAKTFQWAFTAPVTAIAVGFGFLLLAKLLPPERKFLAGTFNWFAGILISTGATGYLVEGLREVERFQRGVLRKIADQNILILSDYARTYDAIFSWVFGRSL